MASSGFPPTYYSDWFQRHAVTRGNAVAVATPAGKLTYAGFYRAVHAIAYRLAESGVRAGEIVGICVESQPLHCVLIVALNRMGCVPMTVGRPLDEGTPIILPEGLSIDRVLVEEPFSGVLPAGALRVHLDWLKTGNERPREWQAAGLLSGEALAHIFASSGTTGKMKAVGLSMRKIEQRLLKRSIGVLNTGRSGKTLTQFGLRSTIGFQVVFTTLWSGGTVFLGFPESAVASVIAGNGIERIEGSPAQFQWMLRTSDLSKLDLSSLRLASVGGSIVSQPLAASIRSRLCKTLVVHYGATELGAIAFGPFRPSDPAGYCGHLMPWMRAEAVDQNGNPVPPGEEGQLRFRCEEMGTGYLNDPDASATFFRDGWFYSGDTGSISSARALVVTGRSSERINAGGVKVAPEVIEGVAQSFRGVRDCAAFGMPDPMGVEKIWVAVVADPGLDLEALRKHCAGKLGSRAPQRIVRLGELPRNETGKLLRGSLPKLVRDSVAAEEKSLG